MSSISIGPVLKGHRATRLMSFATGTIGVATTSIVITDPASGSGLTFLVLAVVG
jgi:hypothetical protein